MYIKHGGGDIYKSIVIELLLVTCNSEIHAKKKCAFNMEWWGKAGNDCWEVDS